MYIICIDTSAPTSLVARHGAFDLNLCRVKPALAPTFGNRTKSAAAGRKPLQLRRATIEVARGSGGWGVRRGTKQRQADISTQVVRFKRAINLRKKKPQEREDGTAGAT